MLAVMANRRSCNSREQASRDGVRGRNVVRKLEFIHSTHPNGGHCHSRSFYGARQVAIFKGGSLCVRVYFV